MIIWAIPSVALAASQHQGGNVEEEEEEEEVVVFVVLEEESVFHVFHMLDSNLGCYWLHILLHFKLCFRFTVDEKKICGII